MFPLYIPCSNVVRKGQISKYIKGFTQIICVYYTPLQANLLHLLNTNYHNHFHNDNSKHSKIPVHTMNHQIKDYIMLKIVLELTEHILLY